MEISHQSNVVPFITIRSHTQSTILEAESALQKLKSKPTGRDLLTELEQLTNHERTVTLLATRHQPSASYPLLTLSQMARYGVRINDLDRSNVLATEISRRKTPCHLGEGVSAEIIFNTEEAVDIKPDGTTQIIKSKSQSYLTLAHELIHALHYLQGSHTNDHHTSAAKVGTYHEEIRTVGIFPYTNERISENKIRAESGLIARQNYFTSP